MNEETLDLPALAKYLQRDARDLEKLASQGRLPARKVGGQWRFNRSEVHEWLEQVLVGLSDQQLQNVEVGVQGGPDAAKEIGLLVCSLLRVEQMVVPMNARTAPGVLQELVAAANANWHIYEPEKVLAAVRAREELCTTAMPHGIAIPHTRRPMPEAIGDSIIAYGRTLNGIAFGAPRGQLTDVFFLVLCTDERLHLQVLARLSRILQRDGFLDRLREAATPAESFAIIKAAEEEVVQG